MSLQSIKSQIVALGKRLDLADGRGQSVEYVWSAIDDAGNKIIHAGNIRSRAREVIEIQAGEEPGTAPKVFINGEEQIIGATAPGITFEEVLTHA